MYPYRSREMMSDSRSWYPGKSSVDWGSSGGTRKSSVSHSPGSRSPTWSRRDSTETNRYTDCDTGFSGRYRRHMEVTYSSYKASWDTDRHASHDKYTPYDSGRRESSASRSGGLGSLFASRSSRRLEDDYSSRHDSVRYDSGRRGSRDDGSTYKYFGPDDVGARSSSRAGSISGLLTSGSRSRSGSTYKYMTPDDVTGTRSSDPYRYNSASDVGRRFYR